MKKSFLVFILLVLCLFTATTFAQEQGELWREYIDGSVGKSVYYLCNDVQNKFFKMPNKYRALDLGTGSGNEAIDLVSKGWEVLGTDTSPRSGEVIAERANGLPGKFQFQQGDFSTTRLTGHYDLVTSFFALPFGDKRNLPAVLNNISQHMQSGAVLAINFFGEKHDFVKKGLAYGTNKEEIINYLKANRFKVIFFLNRVYNQRDFSGDQIHWDIYDVIALKM